MDAFVLNYESRTAGIREVPDPELTGVRQVRIRVDEIGVCGTDRELAAFRLGKPPSGERHLILGHEALGTVIETGPAVRTLKAGDRVVPTIRRQCEPPCSSCSRNRSDLCVTGNYGERGIYGMHGYAAAYAVDEETDLVRIPDELADVAVLTEPLSVVEKAVTRALRMREDSPKSALVLGAGPVGLLAAMTLSERGLAVTLHSLESSRSPRAKLARLAGARYVERLSPTGRYDLVLEATGSASAAFEGIRRMGPLGVCALLGAGMGSGEVSFLDLVVGNQIVFGTVNASAASFTRAVQDLAQFDRRVLAAMIERVGMSEFSRSLSANQTKAKLVHVLH